MKDLMAYAVIFISTMHVGLVTGMPRKLRSSGNAHCSSLIRLDEEGNHYPPPQDVTLFCDWMMNSADKDGDNKLSSVEITNFYETLGYHGDVADIYGISFIESADVNSDGSLDGPELLEILILVDPMNNTKR